jgi:hypothetical protein
MVTVPLNVLEDMQRRLKTTQEPLPPIDYDEGMDRTYIPIAGGWEIQTKGTGSSFRICDTKTDERFLIGDSYLHDMLETLARENREATHPPKQWQGLSDDEIKQVIIDEQIPVRTGKTANRYARAIEAKLKEKNHE